MPEIENLTFTRESVPTIMDGEVIRWTGAVPWGSRPDISASRNGVHIGGGWPIMGRTAVEQTITQLYAALVEYEKLRDAR